MVATSTTPQLQISVSQIKSYLRCPESYRLKYVLGEQPAFVPTPFAFGAAFHSALAALYSAVRSTGSVPSLDNVQSVFVDEWTSAVRGPLPLQLDDDDDSGDLIDKGKTMLATYYEHAASQTIPVVEHVEKKFSVDLYDPDSGEVLEEKLAGVIDLVVREESHPVIVEHKSSSKKYSLDQLRYDIQPTAYAYAAELLGWGEVGLRFNVVTKTKKPAVQTEDVLRDDQDTDDFLRTVVGILRAIDAGAFFPVRGWQCRSCPFSHACSGRPS